MRAVPFAPSATRLAALALVAFTALVAAAPPALAQSSVSDCPLNFTATAQADGSVRYHWTGFGGADGYQVFGRQGMGNSAPESPMLGGGARDATRTGLAAGTYTFWVTAYHTGSVVASSCERTVTVGGPQPAPACPAQVNATFQPPASVVVAWTPIQGATGYRIARSVDGGAPDDNYATAPQSQHPSFTDTGVSPGHTYTYRVTSANTRLPPEACQGASATEPGASVPMFPTPAAWLAAAAGCAAAGLLLTRRR